jgi:iron complex outermembrane receptor protein
MNKLIYSTLLLIMTCTFIQAQNKSIKIKVLSATDQSVLIGATVYFDTLDKGAITDFDGIASFNAIPAGKHSLVISYLGFESKRTTIDLSIGSQFEYSLTPLENQLEEVILQASRSTRTIENIPTRIEIIGGEELAEKAFMNPTNISMVLRESTGIQMQQTSLSSGNSSIRIQGLDGRYTQLLRDGFPLYGGFSSGLSILQIPPLDLRQFEIIKGSSSTLYGGGAIAGLVNLASKTPDYEPALDLMFTQTHAAGSTANVFYSKRNNSYGISLYGSAHNQKVYDAEDDGFSNLPKTKSIAFNPKFYYYPSERTTIWLGLNGTYDERIGGDINKINSDPNSSDQYTEENISKRFSSQAVYTTAIDSTSKFTIKNSISYFDRKLNVPVLTFEGEQFNSFSEASYETSKIRTDWIFGANLYTSNFDENEANNLQRDQKETSYGIFAKNVYDLTEKWILETGFRLDHSNNWGSFALPRVSLLYKNNQGFSSRIGGGLGYKIPDIFTEEAEIINFQNVLPIDKNNLKAESSYGANLDFNYRTQLSEDIGFSINQLFYATAINNGLLLNSTTDGFYAFENATGTIISKGAETNMKFTYADFKWFLNYALIDTRLNYLPENPQKPLTAKHNGGSVIMYETEKWRIGFETYYTGKQLLAANTESTDFTTLGLLLVRNLKWGSTFVNFENFTDRRQTRFTPLSLGQNGNPGLTQIYAPNDGFIFSVGVILKPFGNEVHHD